MVTLKTPRLDGRPFYIRTYASPYAIGAMIEQVHDEGHHHPLAFWSRKLTTRQRNCSQREQDAYAILCALQCYDGWSLGHRVEVMTDHKSLESWRTEHVDTPGGPAGRRGRWHEFLSKFDLHVTYIPGRYNTVAGALSRWAYPASEAYSEVSFHGTWKDKGEVIEFDKEEQALIKKHCLQCSKKNRMKVELVRCKEITKADQTERVNSDSASSQPLRNVFPLTRSKAKSKRPPEKNEKETQPGVAGSRTPPPAVKPSKEWRGVAHRNLRQEWRETNQTTHQPQPHHTPPPPADPSQEWRGTAPGTLSQEWGGPPTTTGREAQPGVAGSSTQETPPGVARDQPHHTLATTPPTHHRSTPHTRHHTPHTTQPRRQRNPARSGGEPQPGPSARSGEDRPPPTASKPSQEWRRVAHRNLSQKW